ncbi:hypothetical protein FKM82_028659, partial [Ascaphus truei]
NHTTPHYTTPTPTNHTTAHTNHTTTPTNHTTPHYTTAMPLPFDYTVNGTAGPCLRVRAILEVTFNGTEGKEITVPIPPVPATKPSGKCSNDSAELTLKFPRGELSLTFRQVRG